MRAVIAGTALALAAMASAAGGGRPVPVSGCEALYYERPGEPRLLVVSDLPLESSAHTAMHQMTQAIKLTVKERGFRAGSHSVGYVVCDDSGPAGSWSGKRCRRNARAAARNEAVVGVIGTLDSGCARAELPVLAAAKIALVSPLNTAPDLTRSRAATVVRLSARDDVQAAAAARFLRLEGVRSVAAFSDGSERNDAYRSAFVRSARALGLRTVVRGGADAAYVAGDLSAKSRAELVAARKLARGGPVVLSAGYGPAAQLAAEVGTLAEGMFLAVAGVPVERLGAAGDRFVTRFESAIGTAPHPYAVYAAQAAQVLLDAIAASNGTRASVARAALSRRIASGLVGPVSFDANGDLKQAPVTIFRVQGGSAHVVRVLDSGLP
jgi:branched-chain amino acid transport system substrate-binding protein